MIQAYLQDLRQACPTLRSWWQITLIRLLLSRTKSLATGSIYKIFSCCVQYFGTSQALFFPDTILVDELSVAHLFTVDYNVVRVVDVRHFPLAGQHKYP